MTSQRRMAMAFAIFSLAFAMLFSSSGFAQTLAYQSPSSFPFVQRGFALPQFQSPQLRSPQFQMEEPDEADDPGISSRREMPSHLRRQAVRYTGNEPAGTIVVDTPNTYLYYVLGNGQAIRYGIGVGRDGFRWSGVKAIERKAEWPDWVPPREMIARQPYLPRFVAGGPHNPLGARALYIGGTIYRIHGTNTPSSIGQRVSSGCIRMLNEDVIDLYGRAKIGGRVVVLPDTRRVASRP
jgi:lipoprotein-anchoring transpeptidase ErfK/SrfK